MDPGFRTGCKLVVLNEYGDLFKKYNHLPPPLKIEKRSLDDHTGFG
ncbi:MAG: hypothetical protein R2784_19080 [Saprospiraceae bacterium]